MPFNIFADEGPAEEVCERTENLYSDTIICETLTIMVQRPLTVMIYSQCITAYMFGKNHSLSNVLSYIYSLAVSLYFNGYTALFFS